MFDNATYSELKSRKKLRLSFFLLIFLIYLFSFFGFDQINVLSPVPYLELFFFLGSLTCLSRINRSLFVYFAACSLYIFYSFIVSFFFGGDSFLDFVQAYKAFFYIGCMVFVVNVNIFNRADIIFLFRVSFFVFFIKYLLSKFLADGHISIRPGVIYENNYELLFLFWLYYFSNKFKPQGIGYSLGLILIVYMSGSRSGSIIMILAFLFSHVKDLKVKTIIYFLAIMLLMLVPFYIFIERFSGSLMSIDRFQFAGIFLNEISQWSFFDYFVGSTPITPLSPDSCAYLSFYSSLFSFSGDGSCYSVILHSYILRGLFDHGIVGLIFLFVFVFKILSFKGYSYRDAFFVLSVLFVNSLSVSSLNSVFFAIPMLLVLTLKNSEENKVV